MSSNATESERKFPERFMTVGKLLMMSGFLVAVFLLSAIAGMSFAVRGKVVTVPSLIGMTVEDARLRVARLGLSVAVSARRYDARMPEGSIISQLPGAGMAIKADRDVQVLLSLGRKTTPVPNLIGSSLRAARLMAEQTGFEIATVSEVSLPGQEEGRVLAQHPAPRLVDNIGDQIDVLVNREEPIRYVMPELVGQHLSRVIQFLDEAGLQAGRIQYRPNSGARRGTVLRQFPEAGYALRAEDRVNLEIAR